MRGLIFGIAGLLLLASPAFCQVDTLQLVEIGQIEAPAEITNLYVEDLDGDSLKEIILTTATNIHIYNGITYEEIWTSPGLVNPQDLLFEDIDNDGLLDVAAKDSIHIWLFDVANQSIIWSSPDMDYNLKCFTTGDRNNDEQLDVALLTSEYVEYPRPHDSIRIHIYNGPSFEPGGLISSSLPIEELIPEPPGWWWIEYTETVAKLVIAEISGSNGLRPIIFLSTRIDAISNYLFIYYYYHSGNIVAFDGSDLFTVYEDSSGYLSFHEIANVDQSSFLHSLTRATLVCEDIPTIWEWSIIRLFSADTLEYSASLIDPNDQDWRGFTIGDINYSHSGREICYGNRDSLFLVTSISADTLWEAGGPDHPFRVLFNYTAESQFDNPQVVCSYGYNVNGYKFYSGSDGSLAAVLSDFNYLISQITDIDADGNDEILSVDENILFIYGLQRTGIEDESVLPDEPFLLSNYPNPFNSSTTIEYGLPQAGHVTIEIYDLLGRKVEMLVDEEEEAGTYQVIWDAGNRSSGVYFYRITAGEFAETRRMVLLK